MSPTHDAHTEREEDATDQPTSEEEPTMAVDGTETKRRRWQRQLQLVLDEAFGPEEPKRFSREAPHFTGFPHHAVAELAAQYLIADRPASETHS